MSNHDSPIARCQKCRELVYWDDTELYWACECTAAIERPDDDGIPCIVWPRYWEDIEVKNG